MEVGREGLPLGALEGTIGRVVMGGGGHRGGSARVFGGHAGGLQGAV